MKKTFSIALFALMLAATAPATQAHAQVAKNVTDSAAQSTDVDTKADSAAPAENEAKKDQPAENKKQAAVKGKTKPVENAAGADKAAAEKSADDRAESGDANKGEASDAANDDTAAPENQTTDSQATDNGISDGQAKANGETINTSDSTAAKDMNPKAGDTTATGGAVSPKTADKADDKTEGKTDAEKTAKNECTEIPEPPKQAWPEQGIFGKYDMAAVQRGFQVYKEVCSACHSMKFMSYRDLAGLGYTPDEVKALAAEVTVTDGPNDDGEMFDRPGRPSDHFKSPFVNEKAARAANGGALPPDMSLLVKAREHGEDYIYAVLNGYSEPPKCAQMNPGKQWNRYFPPHQISMPKPLADGQVSFDGGAPNTLPDEAKDVVQFLAYASEPHMEARKFMGIKVLLFLLVFAGIMRAVKTKVWKDVH